MYIYSFKQSFLKFVKHRHLTGFWLHDSQNIAKYKGEYRGISARTNVHSVVSSAKNTRSFTTINFPTRPLLETSNSVLSFQVVKDPISSHGISTISRIFKLMSYSLFS